MKLDEFLYKLDKIKDKWSLGMSAKLKNLK